MRRDLKKLRVLVRRKSRGVKARASDTYTYYRALQTHTRDVASLFNRIVLPVVVSNTVNDSIPSDVRVAFKRFNRVASALPSVRQSTDAFRRVAESTDKYHRRKFIANATRAIGVDIRSTLTRTSVDRAVRQAMRDNFKLIKSISTSYERRALAVIRKGLTSGSDAISLKKELLELGGFDSRYEGTEIRRARFIARDQSQKLMNAIDRARQSDAGITHYYWDAVIDERTDDDHKDNDGKRFAWASPPKTGHPGLRPNCRCVARPDFSTMKAKNSDKKRV